MSRRNKEFIFQIITIYSIFLIAAFLFALPLALGQTPINPSGLRQIPQDYYIVTTPPTGVQQSNSFGINNEMINNIITMLAGSGIGGGISSLYAKIKGDKAEKKAVVAENKAVIAQSHIEQTNNVVKEQAQTQVKLATVAQKSLELQYENMGDKANEIKDKPEIQLKEVAKIKDEAVKTTAKA
jgi:hypothetical protein